MVLQNRRVYIPLFAVGVLFLGIAAVFAWAGRDYEPNMYFMTGMFLVFSLPLLILGVWFRRGAAKAKRIREHGIPGRAEIVELTQTGWVAHEINPQVAMKLDVHLEDGCPPYTVETKEFVPAVMLGRLTSGVPFPVRANRDDPADIVILWDRIGGSGGLLPGPGSTVAGVPIGQAAPEAEAGRVVAALREAGVTMPDMAISELEDVIEAQRRDIRANGISGTATVRSATDLGQDAGNRRLMQLDVEIAVDDGRAPFRVAQAGAVPAHVAERVTRGFTAPVTVHRDDPQLVVFEWDAGS